MKLKGIDVRLFNFKERKKSPGAYMYKELATTEAFDSRYDATLGIDHRSFDQYGDYLTESGKQGINWRNHSLPILPQRIQPVFTNFYATLLDEFSCDVSRFLWNWEDTY